MLVELGQSGEIKLTKVPFFWSELWNKLNIVRLVNFYFQCHTWKSVHPWIIILWVYIDISYRWKWFYPRIIALISSRGSKQFHLRLIVLRCQRADGNNSTRGSYCFSIEPRIETIWSAVLRSGPNRSELPKMSPEWAGTWPQLMRCASVL